MKVRELIKRLQLSNPEDIVFGQEFDGGDWEINQVTVRKIFHNATDCDTVGIVLES